MISLECATWSAAHFLPNKYGQPGRPWRDSFHILGFPQADGQLPANVASANQVATAGAAIALAAAAHGARVVAETPAPRGVGANGTTAAWPTDALKGAENHVFLFDHPEWVRVRQEINATIFVSDLCTFQDIIPSPHALRTEKATAFLVSQNAASSAGAHLDGFRCNHKKGTHKALRGADDYGGYKTAGSESYSSALCRALADILTPDTS